MQQEGVTRAMGYKYAGGDDIGAVAWYDGNSGSKTHSTGSKRSNDLGLYDMAGNVWEWTASKYLEVTYKCTKGGGWSWGTFWCWVSDRYPDNPTFRNSDLGFRLAYSH